MGIELDRKQVINMVNKFIDEYKVIGSEKSIYKINDHFRKTKMKLDGTM
jgi:hypothetical protein